MLSARVGMLPTLKKIAASSSLAVALEDAKAHLRIDPVNTAEDSVIEGLIQAATDWVENYCRISILESRWRMRLDHFPTSGEPIELPIRPLVVRDMEAPVDGIPLLVSSRSGLPTVYLKVGVGAQAPPILQQDSPVITVRNTTDDADIIIRPAEEFFLAHDGNPPTVALYGGGDFWPMVPLWRSYPVSVEWTAGMCQTAADVPKGLKQAILLLVGHYFLNREAVSVTAGMPMPFGVAALLSQYESGELA